MQRLSPERAWPLFDAATTRRIEAAAAADLPPHTLMQRAGLAVARLALALAPHARTLWVACGPGNNGGDGLEAALHLQRWGKAPVVTWLGDPARCPADTRASLARCQAAGLAFAGAPPEQPDFCIDALLGLGGLGRPPTGLLAEHLARLQHMAAPVLCVDLPSGLATDTGQPQFATDSIANSPASARAEACFDSSSGAAARFTLSLLTLKPGLFTAAGRDAAGQVWLDTLGVAADEPPSAWLGGPPAPRPRPHASHKGSHGDVAVLGGAPGMAGAALLAARAALHAGAGRVLVGLLDPAAAMALDAGQPELMLRPPAQLAWGQASVVCGCGGGHAVAAWLPAVLGRARQLVLDADALNALAADTSLFTLLRARTARGAPTVLTPHPLEAARLLGCSTAEVQADRLRAARELAARCGAVVLLKGSGTLVAAPQRTPVVNPTGNARLASAGTGDVLAGLLGARLADGLPAFEAACAAAHTHGAVADAWPASQALTAGALAQRLPPPG